jgi:hypothetical protein
VGSEQVAKYLTKYGLVVVTNLRQFVIVARVQGQPTQLEAFTIAPSEKAFWKLIGNPRKLTEAIGDSFNEYLTRVLLQAAPLTAPKEVAWFLASYARDAKARIEGRADLPGLATLRTALEEALGLKFTGEDGEHFFRSSLVQTLFYGVFSAWVLWCKRPTTGPKDKFNWHEAAWSLHVPMIKTLFEQEMEEERDAAELVKCDKTILVVLGNPPYYAFAGVSPEEEQGLVEPYKGGLASEWKIRKYNLDELYVRFLRLAERRIAEMSKRGVVCYISSYSYLSDPSFVVVRKRLCEEFNYAWLDCLNGDSRETGKLTPEGNPDPSVFSTEYNREGIRLGTSVGLFAKTGGNEPVTVRYREFWGTDKRAALLKTLENADTFDAQ